MSNALVVNSPQRPVPVTIIGGAVAGATPGGSDKAVQFNNAGAFGGSVNFTYTGLQIKLVGAYAGVTFDSGGTDGILNIGGIPHQIGFFINSVTQGFIGLKGTTGRFDLGVTYGLGWTSGGAEISPDSGFGRNAAGVVEVNNGTAGTFADMKLRNLLVQTGGKATGAGTVPPGGTTGQILKKLSNADYDVGWVT